VNAAVARYVAVEGNPAGDAADVEPGAQQRTAVRRQLREGGRQAAASSLWLPASLMLALCPLGVWALCRNRLRLARVGVGVGLTGLALAGGLRCRLAPAAPRAAQLGLAGFAGLGRHLPAVAQLGRHHHARALHGPHWR
jgi:hypothetical protein